MPPVATLLEETEWLSEDRAWRTMFRIDAREKQILAAALDGKHGYVAELLGAAAAGPNTMLACLRGDVGGTLVKRNRRGLAALLTALHNTSDPAVSKALVRLSQDQDAPILVREAVETSIARHGWSGASAGDWLAWSKGRLQWEATVAGIGRAARCLRKNDAKILDSLFSRLESTPLKLRRSLFYSFANGLAYNSRPMQIPWTEDRIFRLLLIHPADAFSFYESLGHHWRTPAGRTMIASALLRRPSQASEVLVEEPGIVGSLFRRRRGEEEDHEVEQQWNREIVARFLRRWKAWTAADRQTAIQLVCSTDLLSNEVAFPQDLHRFLRQLTKDEKFAENAKDGLAAVAKRWKE